MEESKTEFPVNILGGSVSAPAEHDVVIYEGEDLGCRRASLRLEKLALEHVEDYNSRDRFGKAVVAANVLQEFKRMEPPGRFLRQTGERYDSIGDRQARHLVNSLLRQKSKGSTGCLVAPIPFGQEDSRATSQLYFETISGRKEEQQILLDTLSSLPTENPYPRVLLVLGKSGIGKTTLVESLTPEVEKRRGLFLRGSFGSTAGSDEVVTVFSSMMSSFVEQTRDDSSYSELLKSNFDNDEASLLVKSCPSLTWMLDGATDGNEAKRNSATVKVVLSLVMKALNLISSTDTPVVVLFDSVNRASVDAVDLLVLALASIRSRNMMVILTSSSNDSQGPEVAKILRSLRHETVCTLLLRELTETEVCELVGNVLQCESSNIGSFGRVIFFLSKGHPRSIIDILKLLEEDELIFFDYDTRKWAYDEHLIRNVIDESCVQSLTSRHLSRLSDSTKSMLACASCLGFVVEEHILRLLCPNVEQAIVEAMHHGFLVSDLSLGSLRFESEETFRAAYSIIPSASIGSVHEGLGRTLLRTLNDLETEANLFTIVNQFTKCQLKRQKDRVSVAELCLRAGEKAANSSLFNAAREYALVGISQLHDRGWKDEYALMLRLHNAAAETCYCTGRNSHHQMVITAVYNNARSFEDSLHAKITEINSLAAEDQLLESVALGVDVLSKLGVKLPRSPSPTDKNRAMSKTRRQLAQKSVASLMRLPPMIDSIQLSIMQVINTILLSVIYARPNLLPSLVSVMINLTISSGLSPMSGIGFAFYGMLLCSNEKSDVLEGYKFGKLGLDIVNVCGTRDPWLSRVSVPFYGCTSCWSQDYKTVVEPLKQAYRRGLLCGDVEYAVLSASLVCWVQLFALPVPVLCSELREVASQMEYYGQFAALTLVQPAIQYCLNLMGKAHGDPLELTGEVVYESDLKRIAEVSNPSLLLWIKFYKGILAAIFNDWDESATQCDGLEVLLNDGYGGIEESQIMCFLCLTGVRKPKGKRMAIARRMRKRLQHFAQFAPHNMLGLSWLVEAETARFKTKPKAKSLYVSAMTQLHDDGLHIIEALACELYAEYLQSLDEPALSRHFYSKARSTYESIGAKAKVDRMRQQGL